MKKRIKVRAGRLTPGRVTLEAEPESLELDLPRTGIVIVDMQNAFLTKGAYVDLKGINVTPRQAIVAAIKKLATVARAKGCPVIYLVAVHHPGDAGTGPDSVYWHKEGSLVMYREHPELRDRLLFADTWGAEVVKGLEPRKGDLVVEKGRYSGFFDTNFDTILKRYNLKYLLTTGVAANCCVEATIRDAYYRGYFAILVSDATAASGPEFMQSASIYNVKTFYGWVTTTANLIKAMV